MSNISLIAAIDEDAGLGRENQLLCHLPADLKHFKEMTLGKTVIMGRKTYESIGKPLPNRHNIVVSRTVSQIEGVELVSSLEQALALAKPDEELMVIGGASLYKLALPLAQRIYLTRIHHLFDADVFFPFFDETQWQCKSKTVKKKDDKNPYDMTFLCYERKSKN